MAERTEEQRNEDLAVAEAEAAREAAASADGGADAAAEKVRRPRAKTTTAADEPATLAPAGATRVTGGNGAAGRLATAETATPAAGTVTRLEQGGLPEASADTIEVRQGGIGRASAQDISVSMGGIGMARADRVSVELGGIGAAFAGEVDIRQGAVNAVVAREVELEQAFVQTIVAANVEIEERTTVLVLIAGRVEGSVRTILDWRGALAFGAAFGALFALVRRRR